MKTLRLLIPVLPLLLGLSSCSNNNGPVQRRVTTIDTVFTQARVHTYGQYYKGLDLQVVSLDLYSSGLSADGDTTRRTGTNLYFSDIFIDLTDTRLPEAEYTLDSVPALHHVLPALNFDGLLTGSCLMQVTEGETQSITLFSGGRMSVKQEGDTTVMDFRLNTTEQRTYHAVYRGVPVYEP